MQLGCIKQTESPVGADPTSFSKHKRKETNTYPNPPEGRELSMLLLVRHGVFG